MAAHWEALLVLLRDDMAAGRLLGSRARAANAAHLAAFVGAMGACLPLCAADPRLGQLLRMSLAALMSQVSSQQCQHTMPQEDGNMKTHTKRTAAHAKVNPWHATAGRCSSGGAFAACGCCGWGCAHTVHSRDA